MDRRDGPSVEAGGRRPEVPVACTIPGSIHAIPVEPHFAFNPPEGRRAAVPPDAAACPRRIPMSRIIGSGPPGLVRTDPCDLA